jgi:hypothetical protein
MEDKLNFDVIPILKRICETVCAHLYVCVLIFRVLLLHMYCCFISQPFIG